MNEIIKYFILCINNLLNNSISAEMEEVFLKQCIFDAVNKGWNVKKIGNNKYKLKRKLV
tara:strand:+ start:31 stop:207 length:177 start_codon:yes stop_codon:yes gene_type:complete